MTPPRLTPSRPAQVRIGLALRRRLAQRREYDRGDAAARDRWRAERLTELVRHAVRTSEHYRHRVGPDFVDGPIGSGGSRRSTGPARSTGSTGSAGPPGSTEGWLGGLPVLDKTDLVEHFDRLVADPGLRRAGLEARLRGEPVTGRGSSDRYRMAMSSGSSGSPAVLAFDGREWVDLIANAARARALAGPPPSGTVRSAKVGSPSPWHLSVQVPATLQDPRKPSLALSAAEPIGATVTALQEWSPTILSSYPSVLRQLLGEQLAGALEISPTQVFSSGEHLSVHTRRLAREVWGVDVFDQYVATEVGFIAAECSDHDGLHVLDDHVVVEVVDDDLRPCGPGEEGHVLVTSLHSRTLPLIRYRLGDRATMAEGTCACGRAGPRFSSIAGADRDVLVLRAAPDLGVSAAGSSRGSRRAQGHVEVHPVTITALVDRLPVGAWVVLHGPEVLRVQVTRPAAGFDPMATRADLARILGEVGVHPDVDVRVEVVPVIEPSGGGKAARFRAITPPEEA